MRMSAIALLSALFLVACGNATNFVGHTPTHKSPPTSVEPVVVIAKATFPVVVGGMGVRLVGASIPVTTALAPSTTFTPNVSSFVVPVMSNSMLDFGSVSITALFTNSLKLCGTGNQKCGKALIRTYTTGGGPGFWNADGYGMVMTAGLTPTNTVGFTSDNATTLQTYTIPSGRNTLRLSDFSPTPVYLYQGDFTDAGAGTYTTTVVIELALSL